ncbi:MAG: hypothetical protein ABI254_17080 [Chthoniobacterales bacterium]
MSRPNQLTFVLRQFLTFDTFEKRVAELVKYCGIWGIDEVLIFPHSLGYRDSPTGYWLPHEVERDQKLLSAARQRFNDVGIRMGLNIFHTLGHGDRGRKMDASFPFDPLVSDTGSLSAANVCPLGTQWLAYYRKCLKAYACVKPSAIFLDDDFRWQNHGQISGEGFFNCFCPLHLRAFNERYGTDYDRARLVADIARPGKPHPAREQWLTLLDDQLIHLAQEIEQTIHSVSPETEVGLMAGTADQMCQEGRSWDRLLQTLAGPGRRMLHRPCYPDYGEAPAREIPESLAVYRQVVFEIPREVVSFAEIDNCMPTEFNSSVGHLSLRIALATLCGARHFHLSLFDWNGNEDTFSGQPEYGEMLPLLRESLRPILEKLEGEPIAHGIQLPINPQRVLAKETTVGAMDELKTDSLTWAKPLQLAGFPITFESSWIVALTEVAVRGLNAEDAKELLRKTAILEGTAVKSLTAKGFGNLIGVKEFTEHPVNIHRINSEKNVSSSDPNQGAHYDHHPLHALLPEFNWELDAGANVITQLVGRGNVPCGVGTFSFENELGGKTFGIPLYARALLGSAFLTRYRLEMLRQELAHRASLAKAPFCFIEGQPNVLPLHIQYGTRHLLACANLHTQHTSSLYFHCHSLPPVLQGYLWHENKMEPAQFVTRKGEYAESYVVEITTPIPHLGICILMT